MATITREVVFAKLGTFAMKSLQRAHDFAKTRGDSYIEPVHWLAVWLNDNEGDVPLILDRLGVQRETLLSDVQNSLSRLRHSRSSRLDFSDELELAIERGWISTSLVFGDARVRTGHLLHGMLDRPELKRLLASLSTAFIPVDATVIAVRFQDLTRGSSEEGDSIPDVSPEPAPAQQQAGGDGALDKFTTDLTAEACAGKIDPVHGRDGEIRQVVDILMRRRQNNPMIVGEAGVGKTALVEGLALRVAAGDVPPPLRDIRLLTLDVAAMQAGASVRGEFENRLKSVIREVQNSSRPIILFIDEAHILMGAGGTAGTGDAANLLKPALARGVLRTIAATTWSEYKKHIEKDAALTRRFQTVQVDEPAEDTAIRMLRGLTGTFESHHKVQLLDEALSAAVKLSARYIQGRQLPDKAVSVLDTACARVAMSQATKPAEIEGCLRRISDLETERSHLAAEARIGIAHRERDAALQAELESLRMEVADLEARYQTESDLVSKILSLRAELRGNDSDAALLPQLEELQQRLSELQSEAPLVLPAVDGQAVAAIVEGWTGIPVKRMLTDEIEALLHLVDTLKARIVGQDHALEQISRRIETARAGLDNPGRPKGVFLLVGPSGVGKTETALALAEQLFGSEEHIIAINMSEFQEAHTVSTLKGAPPGYVGYGEGGRLTEAVRRKPYSVILLDEIEKAHPDVHEIFFQVFDKGVMEDGEGRRIDFRNTLILLTSNVGSDLIMQLAADPDLMPDPDALSRALRPPLLKTFPAALLGRLLVIPYYPLTDATLNDIIGLQLSRVARRVSESQGVPFTYDAAVVDLIRSRCTALESGGRMIDSILTGSLLPAISREVLKRISAQEPLQRVHVTVTNDSLNYVFD
jgi:type VI secretion system protein VasG